MSAAPQPIRPPMQLRLWNDQEISVATTARILRTSPEIVRRLIERGVLRAYRHGEQGWYQVSYESVADYIEKLRSSYLIEK